MARAHRTDYLSLLDEVVDLRKGSRRGHDLNDYLASCGAALFHQTRSQEDGLDYQAMTRIQAADVRALVAETLAEQQKTGRYNGSQSRRDDTDNLWDQRR